MCAPPVTPPVAGCAANIGFALACTTGSTRENAIASNDAKRKLRGFTASPGLEVLPGTGHGQRRQRAVLAAASTVGYVRLPSLQRDRRQPTAVNTLMEDIPRYVRSVG